MSNSYTLRSGFFDSVNGDRPYGAEDLNNLFDGIIADGIIESYGNAFNVKAGIISQETAQNDESVIYGMSVRVFPGKSYFKGIWAINDTVLVLDFDEPPFAMKRMDAIIIKIDRSERTTEICIKKGEPNTGNGSEDPLDPDQTPWLWPTMEHSEFVDEYPIAYVGLDIGTTNITDSMIHMCIGAESPVFETTPISAAILTGATLENYLKKTDDVYTQWFLDHWDYVRSVNDRLEQVYDEASLARVFASLEEVKLVSEHADETSITARDVAERAENESQYTARALEELDAIKIAEIVEHVKTLERKVFGKVQLWGF